MGIFMGMNYQIILKSTFSAEIVRLIAEIDEFKGRWEALKDKTPERLSVLRQVATIASIGSSTRIEGSKLTDAQVEELLSNIGKKSFRSRDEEEVGGYADTMNMIFDSYREINISENHIKQLHGNLLKYSTKDERHKGEYKKFPNHVEAFDEYGNLIGVVFETAAPFYTPMYTKELIDWYDVEIKGVTYHPLILIGAFIVHFLAIHPFQDGNGRLSRILTTLMLLKEGYHYVPYCSLESIVEENKEQYYLNLRRAQTSFKTDHGSMDEWLVYFLKMLKKQKDILFQRLEREKVLAFEELLKVEVKIIGLVTEHKKLTIGEIVVLTGINRNTAKKYMKRLVEKGHLKMSGVGKGSWYTGG